MNTKFPILLAGLMSVSSLGLLTAAEEPSAAKSFPSARRAAQRIQQLEQQLLQLQRERQAARDAEQAETAVDADESANAESAEADAEPASDRPAARFQMLKSGDRIVILDTVTGETRIIEPATSPRPLQNVEVGRAWVVVTVLGRVINELPPSAKQADEKPPTPAQTSR